MVDISDFLRGRGVPEDAILLMEEQKVSNKKRNNLVSTIFTGKQLRYSYG